MLERETGFFDVSGGEEGLTPEKTWKVYVDFLTRGLEEELSGSNPVLRECRYVRFISNSKGRGRKRKYPDVIELFHYSSRWRMIINGVETRDIDKVATEVLGESVSPQECTETFLERLRQLGRF